MSHVIIGAYAVGILGSVVAVFIRHKWKHGA